MFLFLNSAIYADYGTSDTGTTAAVFLKLAPGARAGAMGEAYAPVADDVYSIYYNPAGLNYIRSAEMSFMHSFWFEGINYSYLAYARPFEMIGGKIGAGITYLNYGSIERITNEGESEGGFSPYDLAVALSYARRIYGIDAGLAIKYVYQNIYKSSNSALALDFGLRGRFLDKKLDIGFSFSNLGSDIKLNNNSHALPFIMRFGAGYRIINNLTAAVQINIPDDNEISVNAGSEYLLGSSTEFPVSIRAGYRSNNSLGGIAGFSFGFGVLINKIQFDYALSPYDKLGAAHRISLSLKSY